MKQVVPRSIIFTKTGYEELQKKYDTLLKERPMAVDQLKKAREMGDLSENGFYKASKAKLSSVDHQIQLAKHQLRYGKVVQNASSEKIQIGSTVVVDNGTTTREFTIVGEQEANPSIGNISFRSPIGKALLGKKQNETVIINTPKGDIPYSIRSIN